MAEWDDAPLAVAQPAAPAPVAVVDNGAAPWDTAPIQGPSTRQRAVVSATDNGDEAAKAIAIGKQTNLPPSVVQSDLPGYDAHARQQSAIKAVQNPAIAKYIDGNPMAAKVSGDDYEKLDEISQYFENLKQDRVNNRAQVGLFSGIAEVGNLLTSGPGREKLLNALTQLPVELVKGLIAPFTIAHEAYTGELARDPEGLNRQIGLGIGLALGGRDIQVGRAVGLEGIPGTAENAHLAGNEVAIQRAATEAGVELRPKPPSVDDFLAKLRGMQTRKEIDDFIAEKAGGIDIHPLMLGVQKAETASDALSQAVEAAQESKTKARSPETFAEFGDAHDAGNVHIDAAKVMDLYRKEGKAPAEGDGLLGFIPDLAQKLDAGEATGGEITVPIGQYVGHVDPTVHEGLKDSVRLHDDGVTGEEAEGLKDEIKSYDPEALKEPVPAEPASQATQSLGLDTKTFLNLMMEKGDAVGITQPEFKSYSDKIARREQDILDKSVAAANADVKRALTPEWKRQEVKVRDEVTEELKTQGPFAAEKYLRDNKIDIAHARAAEVADDLAPMFGYSNGQDFLRGLESIDTERAASGKGPDVQRREAIKAETARRMEAQHGNLAENIAKEARHIALADHTFDILADEVRLLAKAAGVAPPLSRSEMVGWAKQQFESSNIKDAANWDKLRRAVEKGGREAEKALLKGDFLEAFQAKQRQMLAATLAKESLGLQKVIDGTEKKIDRFSSDQVVPGLDQAHLEQIRNVLASVGLPQHIAPTGDLGTLRDFVDQSEGQIAIAPWLMDGTQPKLQDMNVEQFRAFANSIKSMEHVGRQVNKLFSAMKEADLQNVVFDIKKELERFQFIDQPNNPSLAQRAGSVWRKVIGAHLLVERMLDYTDKFDPHGPLTEWLDRPLRDANSKELAMTEQVTRMLKNLRQYTDGSLLDPIENNLIPDSMDKSGFLQMNRQNLRTLMLNMGNWSNIKKLSEGFGVNEADLRRMIDKNATAKDVAWVNGVWKVFQHLKPEADAVQLRDTGVPVDHIPAVSWEIKGGKLDGGYYPLSYDRYNSDIQGHIAQPLFDKGYFAATTPHGYTQQRTEYSGAIDLTGDFLASKIKSMVHDIAFREAVRSADRLIKNQEFRTALAQRWGKESADLLPGWLRDIANSHNIDDDYAQGFQRLSALVRQNVVSTLIAYNPGTFIKHGFTAAVMSMDRVGLKNLLSATGQVGFSGAAKNISELMSRPDRVPDEAFMQAFRDALDQGQRGNNARQFVLDSSPVMRARQRQYEDSIFGAVQAISKIGPAKTFADFRQRQMQYGRLAVAFSDQMSAIPTWLAAYQKAYLGGETHPDAVFIADKEMSRAHGSSFIGDKPLVGRTSNTPTGEFARWFTSLYNFFNHTANNNFQLAWDASAAIGGNPAGEPGANAFSISRRVGLIMGIIAIEELAGPAKDDDGHGVLARTLFAGLRYFGAGFMGLREVTNGLGHGYEPSTGMIGTLFKGATDAYKDLGKATGVKAGVAKDWITHTATALGFLTGVGGSQIGRTAQFGADVATGRDRPRTFNDYRQGLRTGHSKARKLR